MKKLLTMVVAVILALTMTVPVSAVYNGESVFLEQAPDFAEATGTDANGSAVTVYSWEIIITPEQVASISDPYLKEAFNEIKNAKDLTKVVPGLLEQLAAGVGAEDLVVKDVFDVKALGNAKKILDEGGSINVTFNVDGITGNDTVFVLHKGQNGWEVVPSTVSRDGDVTATFTSLSPVAIVTLKTVSIDPNGPTSPATGEVSALAAAVVAASLLLA